MMKIIPYILIFLTFYACNTEQKKVFVEAEIENTNSISIDSVNESIADFDLNGTWGLTNYFDTIIANKELAKYRIQIPTWFAIILDINNDTLRTYGSIENNGFLLDLNDDTIKTIKSRVTGDDWYLIVSNPYLKLVQGPNSEIKDSTVYTFRKRNDLSHFSKINTDFYIIGNKVTEYFNQKLFKGKYISQETQKEVIFDDNGNLTGFEGFDTYEVRNYFGTLHMHKNLDVLTLKNKDDNEYKQYNWLFSNDKLILTEFIFEPVTYNGETYEGDYLILGKEVITLKKQ